MNPKIVALYKNFKAKLEEFNIQLQRGSKSLIPAYVYITKCMLILPKYYPEVNQIDLNKYFKSDSSFYFDDSMALIQFREKLFQIVSKKGMTLIVNNTDYRIIEIPFNSIYNVNLDEEYISYNAKDFDVEKIEIKLINPTNKSFINKIKTNFDDWFKLLKK